MEGQEKSPFRWSRLPSEWIQKNGLRQFTAGKKLGASVAALKVLVAVVLRAENNPVSKAGHNQGTACMSYDELMGLTDLSRPMISVGIKLLISNGVISIKADNNSRRNRYVLQGYDDGGWAKIPNRPLYRGVAVDRVATLHDLSCRREADLNALKLYLLLCTFRDNKKNYSMIGYEKIHEYTGISEGKIRKAISVLIELSLVRVSREKVTEEKKNHPNNYEILGLQQASSQADQTT